MSRDAWEDDDEGAFRGDRGFLVGRQAALADWRFKKENEGFEKLVATLRVEKWRNANLEHAREWGRTNGKRPEVHAYRMGWKRAKRLQEHRKAPPLTCKRCRVEFCLLRPHKGQEPAYCSSPCRLAAKAARTRAQKTPCACGKPMTGRRKACGPCAQQARRARESAALVSEMSATPQRPCRLARCPRPPGPRGLCERHARVRRCEFVGCGVRLEADNGGTACKLHRAALSPRCARVGCGRPLRDGACLRCDRRRKPACEE